LTKNGFPLLKVHSTYGCLSDDPLERGEQGEFEIREAMLADLGKKEENKLSLQSGFMLLPRSEQRIIMMQHANDMILHYEQTAGECQEWQC